VKTFPGQRVRWQRPRSDLACASLPTRRQFLRQAGFAAALHAAPMSNLTSNLAADNLAPASSDLKTPVPQLGYSVRDVAREAHLDFVQVCGGDASKKYILETTGSGVAFIDYDNDGWLDIFLVNGTRLDAAPNQDRLSNKLFHNNRDGTFSDVTAKAGLTHTGWGQGVCIGDYDNDGFEDIFVTYWGEDLLYHNNGNGTFTEVARNAHVAGDAARWSTGCAFVDYDRDGKLDLFVTHYVNFSLQNAKDPGSNPYCNYRGLAVNCGPRGLVGETSTLYHNNGDGTFSDVSEASGILKPSGYFGLGVLVADFDNDGWPDIYVASDSTPSLLFMNNHDGTFREDGTLRGVAFSGEGQEQAGMGVSAADYDHDGWLDIVKTNFSDEVVDLYHNDGEAVFTDHSEAAGLNKHTHFVGWGCGFFDPDNDGFADVLYVNGHVYPELERVHLDTTYREARVLYRNLGNGKFEDVSQLGGTSITTPSTGRGCAFGDFNNDGCIDVVINNQNAGPSLLKISAQNGNQWINIHLVGKKSNRSAIGARVKCVAGALSQIDEVRSGGSYLSQNDLRLHFGLGEKKMIDLLEIRWSSGIIDQFRNIASGQFIQIEEGGKLTTLKRASQ
jgi:enediyne biosynthesis protein E4